MPIISALPGQEQLISEYYEFFSAAQSFVEELKPHSTARSSYIVVSIIGPQSSGKSSLLNTVCGTNFYVLNGGGRRRQKAKGICISRCTEPCMILMDVDGSDGKERKDNVLFERQSALFALAVSDVLLLNMWFTDIGRREGASSGLLKLVCQERVLISGATKTKVIICIRDHDSSQCSPDKTREDIIANINELWEEAHPPTMSNKIMSDYIEVAVKLFPSRRYEQREFEMKCNDLAQSLCTIAASNYAGQKYYASGFVFSSEKIWTAICNNERLNAADHKVAMSAYICDEIAKQTLNSMYNEKEYQSLIGVEATNLKEFNELLSAFLKSLLCKYEAETELLDRSVRDNKKTVLENDISEKLKPIFHMRLQNLRLEMVSLALSEVHKDMEKLKNPKDLTKFVVDTYNKKFDEKCGDVHRLFQNLCHQHRKELKHDLKTTILQMATDIQQTSSQVTITKLGPCGGDGGGPNDMDINGITRILKISVRHGAAVDALTVCYLRNGHKESTWMWGGNGGRMTEFHLQPSEHITSVKGHIGKMKGTMLVRSLKFETNLGTFGPYGEEVGMPFDLPAHNGQIIGFHGHSGLYLDALGVYVKVN